MHPAAALQVHTKDSRYTLEHMQPSTWHSICVILVLDLSGATLRCKASPYNCSSEQRLFIVLIVPLILV